jgi:glycosyltransferase involved in cell wall biosynthesis
METGLLVDNGSDYWGAALDEMSRNTQLRKKIRNESYIDVASNYGLEKSAKIFFDLISHNLD